MLTRSICLGMTVLLPFTLALAQNQPHQWTSLDGPYWANGIDVAVGDAATSPGNRYLIGCDYISVRLFRWNDELREWEEPEDRLYAKKIISYRHRGSADGLWAFCAVRDDRIFYTEDGGAHWNPIFPYPNPDNKLYSSIEIVNWTQDFGKTVIVGTDRIEGEPTAYYTDDYGQNWAKLGAPTDPLDSWDIYDIETLPDEVTPPVITAGTPNGIYRHSGAWDSQWSPVQFSGLDVPVLESIDRWDSGKQIAAVDDNGTWKLFITLNGWDSKQEILVGTGHDSFDKHVNDMSAVYWPGWPVLISCFVATDEGVHILHFDPDNPVDEDPIDLRSDSEWGYAPMQYDQNITSVDYFVSDQNDWDSAFVVVTTPYNVYEVIEERDHNRVLQSLHTEEIVTGTFKCYVKALSFLESSADYKKIFAVTEWGVIKKMDQDGWKLIGFAFTEIGGMPYGITDIVIDFSRPDQDYILASSWSYPRGTIMRSSDGGNSWTDTSPEGHPGIIAVDLDPSPIREHAYAINDDSVWISTDYGLTWGEPYYFDGAAFKDVMADPLHGTSPVVLVGGGGNTKVYRYQDASWDAYDEGMESVTVVREFARISPAGAGRLLAATDQGVYKRFTLNPSFPWSPRTFGMDETNIGSIVYDRDTQFPYQAFRPYLAAAYRGVGSPRIWASPDSGRSWNELYRGQIPAEARINKLAATQIGAGGFAVATDSGAFYIGDIFKQDEIPESEEWGPGALFVTGDILVTGVNPDPDERITVTISSPCTVLVAYEFGNNDYGQYPEKAELVLMGNSELETINGGETNQAILTSSRPTGGIPGDWGGIGAHCPVSGLDFAGFDLEYCHLEFAETALYSLLDDLLLVNFVDIRVDS